jgi:hypothetical protein
MRSWIEPPGPPTPRDAGRVVAKGTAKNVEAIVDLGDHVAVTHHEGLASSPGGITVRRRSDFSVVRALTGAFGPLETSGPAWIASGPLFRGCHASARLIDPASLAVVGRLPLCRPFARLSDHRIVAHTPPVGVDTTGPSIRAKDGYDVDPDELAASGLSLPEKGGLVEVDLARNSARLLVEARPFDPFTSALLSPDGATLHAATSFGRVVALRLGDGRVLWERPAVRLVQIFSVHALARSADGQRIALAGSGGDHDLLVLDAATGRELRRLVLCRALDGAGVAPRPNARIEALAFHPAGWLGASTNAGVFAELHVDGRISAFRASPASVSAFAFVDGGDALLAGGNEPQLRLWPTATPV